MYVPVRRTQPQLLERVGDLCTLVQRLARKHEYEKSWLGHRENPVDRS